jgi:hypothetical protein
MNFMQAYAEAKNIKKKPVYISRVIYWSRKSGCVKKKTQKNKNKLALLQSMSNRKK